MLPPQGSRGPLALEHLCLDTARACDMDVEVVDVSHLVYVDDLLVILLVSSWCQIARTIELVKQILAGVGLDLNMPKIEVTAAAYGRGSESIKKD